MSQSFAKTPEEQTAPMDGLSDQSEWDAGDCDESVPAWTSDSESRENELPPNPFVFDSAKLASDTNLKRKNVILFGETGVGKSSVINLMADKEVARTSSNLEGCTLEATVYTFNLPGEGSLCVFDTVGLNEPETSFNAFLGAIYQAHRLIASLHDGGGVDLLLFCVRAGRVTTTMQHNYRLFVEFLCENRVPLALVITYLDHEDVMEEWWARNEKRFEEYGIRSVGHACVTAAPARVTRLAVKRAASRSALHKMLCEPFRGPHASYVRDVRSWFNNLVAKLWLFLMKSLLPSLLRRSVLMKSLMNRCGLSRDEAQKLADILMRQGSQFT